MDRKLLSSFSEGELNEELKRRKKKEKELKNIRPQKLESPNMEKLDKFCEMYMDYVEDSNLEDNDLDNYAFEALIESLYGNRIWKWRDYIQSIKK